MVLLLGNYPPDQQQSMQRFSGMMLEGLTARGIEAEIVNPQPLLGNLRFVGRFLRKWLGYIDKYIFFPFQLRRKVTTGSEVIVHICDHSNAVYVNHCRPAPVLVTCHDLLAVRGGLGEDTDCPATFTGRFLQKWILNGLHRADAIACDSLATASDADRLLGESYSQWVSVVPLGLNFDYKQISPGIARSRLATIDSFDLDRAFVLHVGSNLRRKNRDGVLRIVARVKDEWEGQLVFAGEPLNRELRSMAKELGIASRVIEIGNPSNETMEALYNMAAALLYPSRFEGFGWPIIEAQTCGCPVICSNSGPLPEVAGEAGLLHPVEDEAGFAADLLRLTDADERFRWSEKSLVNAARFSTPRMINEYVAIYRRLGASV